MASAVGLPFPVRGLRCGHRRLAVYRRKHCRSFGLRFWSNSARDGKHVTSEKNRRNSMRAAEAGTASGGDVAKRSSARWLGLLPRRGATEDPVSRLTRTHRAVHPSADVAALRRSFMIADSYDRRE